MCPEIKMWRHRAHWPGRSSCPFASSSNSVLEGFCGGHKGNAFPTNCYWTNGPKNDSDKSSLESQWVLLRGYLGSCGWHSGSCGQLLNRTHQLPTPGYLLSGKGLLQEHRSLCVEKQASMEFLSQCFSSAQSSFAFSVSCPNTTKIKVFPCSWLQPRNVTQ